MRNYSHFLLLLVSFGIQPVLAQKHDYMWPLGLGPGWSDYNFFLDFNGFDSPRVAIRTDTMSTGTYAASYCSANGEILLYSNGLSILNKYGYIVENSQNLNPTITLPEWNNKSYPGGESGFFLGKPDDPKIVYFISLDFGPHPAQQWPYMFVGQNLMVATIDITANNGNGKVLEKNKILLSGTLMSPAACRHANGRDWWIMVSDADKNRHYRVLLYPQGFSTPQTQFIGTKPNPVGGSKSNQTVGNCFSPKGKYYVDINDLLGFSIFEFDRCSGELSNEQRIDYPPPSPSYPNYYRYSSGRGAVFSENEQFFYKTTTYHAISSPWIPGTKPYLFQFDLEAENLAASIDTINLVDSAVFHFPTNITLGKILGAELGPDGRIYVVHEGNSYCTVQYPNLKGRACKFIHDKPYFGVVIGEAIPYMPNYRLGPLDGSQCDSLGLNNIPVANFRVDDTLGFFARYFFDLSHHEPAEWHWSFGDGHTSIEQSPLHQFDSAGVYQVCLNVSNQYGNDVYCRTLYLGVSNTDSPVEKEQVTVSPNPFSQQIVVFVNTMLHNPVFLLYDVMGGLVHKARIDKSVNEIQVNDLNNGMYFWEIVSNGKLVKAGKIIRTDN
jgi:PKD repeat protein